MNPMTTEPRHLAHRLAALATFVLVFGLAGPAAAQEEGHAPSEAEQTAMMEAWQKAMTPGPQHAWLAEGVGEYEVTLRMWEGPGEPTVHTATAVREMTMDGRHLEERLEGRIMGMPFTGVGLTGYDNVTGTWWSSWYDNMSTSLTVLEGEVDMEAGTSTWSGEASDAMAGGATPMRIEARREGGKEINEFYMTVPGGEMARTMEIVYTPK